MRWMTWSSQPTRTFWALMVMPRSRSMSIESRYCSRISRASTALVSSRMRSLRVDLPWSMWAMTEMFRIRSIGWLWGAGAFVTSRSFSPKTAHFLTTGPTGWPRSVAGGGIHETQQRLAGAEAPHVLRDPPGQRAPGHLRCVGAVRGDDAVRHIPEGVAIGQRLGVGDVEGGPADRARSQCLHEIVG